ncbi:pentatricopeptide repeat-containing protein At1g12775, mitochondrial-like [Aristolochia californica]|uniref:pentatricopeptide repeat-containing protein At1g12775, mitochondrial-like n=1 Tax=Aristolochia californica TaxID=171875 RepID=UPI0035DE15AB
MGGFCQLGWMEEATKLFQETTEKGHGPDVVTFNTLMPGFYRTGELEAAKKLFRDMEGQCLVPKLVSCRDIECALDLVEDAAKIGQIPDMITYGTLVHGLCKVWEGAKKILGQMSKRGVHPNDITYKALFEGFSMKGVIQGATNAAHDIAASRIAPSSHIVEAIQLDEDRKMNYD